MRKAALTPTEKFEKKCTKVGERNDIEVVFYEDDRAEGAFEDDGSLHVISGVGLRAVFDVSNGQAASEADQNEKTRTVLLEMHMARHITPNVLVDESDHSDDDERCPHCGRGG